MIRSNLVKAAMAFAAGLVVTMGSLIYSRTQELNQLREAAQSATVALVTASGQMTPPGEAKAPVQEGQIPTSAGEAPANGVEASPVPEATQNMSTQADSPVQAEVPGLSVRVYVGEHSRMIGSRRTRDAVQNAVPKSMPSQIHTPPSQMQASAVPSYVPALKPTVVSAAQNAMPRAKSVAPQTEVPKTPTPSSSETIPLHRTPHMATLRAGTGLSIRLTQSVSTERNRASDLFRGELDGPLEANGFVVAERGSAAFGRIVKVKRARFGRSDLQMELTGITTSDGQRIRVQTSSWEERSARRSIEDTPKMAAGAALGAVVGALSGAARGAGLVSGNESGSGAGHGPMANKRAVALPAGSRVTFRLARPVTITERVNYR